MFYAKVAVSNFHICVCGPELSCSRVSRWVSLACTAARSPFLVPRLKLLSGTLALWNLWNSMGVVTA